MDFQFGLAASLSYMAIALLSLPVVGRTVIAFGLLCHLRACCLGNRCAMVLQFGLAALLSYGQSRCSAICGWPHRCCFRITLPSPRLLPRQRVCHGFSVWPCGLTQLEQSRCSAYLWLAAPLLLPDYFSISTLAASAAGVPWFFGLALRPHSTRAIALLSLSVVGRTVIAFGLLCHLHSCCLGSTCAIVLQFGLAALLSYVAIAQLCGNLWFRRAMLDPACGVPL